jgi:DNA-binding MarR family transcriptional regulator
MDEQAAPDRAELRLVRLMRALGGQLDLFGAEFAARNGLHTTDVRALLHLLDAEGGHLAATPGWLSARLGMNSAAVTALVDRLEGLGLVRRERDTRDRRRVLLAVEPAAAELGRCFLGALSVPMAALTRPDFDGPAPGAAERFLRGAADAVEAARREQRAAPRPRD